MTGERRWIAYGALLLAISGIAWSAIFIRWSAVPGPSSAFYRVFIAALVLVPWRLATALRPRRDAARRRRMDRRGLLLAVVGGVFFGFDLALYNSAVMRTTATTATLLGNNAPIFVAIGSWLFFKRTPPRRFWVGLALAMTGAVIVIAANAAQGRGAPGDLAGAFMSVGAAVFFAAYLLATEHVRGAMDTLTFSTLAIVGSVGTLLVVCLVLGMPLSGFSNRT